MRAKALQRIAEAASQVIAEWDLGAGFVVELHRLLEDAPIPGLFQVRGDADDEPVRIVVEAAANVVVASLGQRLVLVVGSAGRQLRGCQVKDAFTGARWNHVDKAQQILVRIRSEEHTSEL